MNSFLYHRDENYDAIYRIAFVLYDHFNTSEEIINMATLMVDNIRIHNATHYFERAAIACISYLIDNDFKVAITPEELDDPNLFPSIPENWKNSIANLSQEHIRRETWMASFFVKRRSQTFQLFLSSIGEFGTAFSTVIVNLIHANNRGFIGHLHSSEVDGLGETDHGLAKAFASHVLKKLLKAWDGLVKRAANDMAPSTPTSPIFKF